MNKENEKALVAASLLTDGLAVHLRERQNWRNKMNNEPTAKMNDVPLACDELENSVTLLDEALMHFQSRLNRITRPEPTSTDTEKRHGQISSCELSGTIRDQANRLRDMAERIREHNAVLEL